MARSKKIGIPWPELNDGLSYDDVVRPSDGGLFPKSPSLLLLLLLLLLIDI
jgi:hypothetical protein